MSLEFVSKTRKISGLLTAYSFIRDKKFGISTLHLCAQIPFIVKPNVDRKVYCVRQQ